MSRDTETGEVRYVAEACRATHARAVFPAPGGPNISVTCPRRIPSLSWSSESSSAASRRGNPVLIGSRTAAEAFSDCDAEIEITGTGTISGVLPMRDAQLTRVLAVETEEVLVDAHCG